MQFTKTIFRSGDTWTAVIANLLVLAVLGWAAGLQLYSPVAYYRGVQEDGLLEWASFWAFALAAAFALWGAYLQRKSTRHVPWFLVCVALFCLVVAMEEISWGQRVLGYRPPPYFLAGNYQQELNFHNVLSTKLRKLGVLAVIIGFGVVLPLLACWPAARRLMDRFAIVTAPIYLLPSFVIMAIVYRTYPWSHTGEWVEMMLGLGFVFGIAIPVRKLWPGSEKRLHSAANWCLAGWLVVMALGAGSALVARQAPADPRYVEATVRELAALKADLSSPGMRSRCGTHRRLYTLASRQRPAFLWQGEFMRLREEGLSPERAQFFLDPWDSPYWFRHDCRSRPRKIIVYSFGPNRRRDSSRTQVLGDDIGVIIQHEN